MKVKDLIEELQKLDPELPVCVYADHGQETEYANFITELYVTEGGTTYDSTELSEEEIASGEFKKVIEIAS